MLLMVVFSTTPDVVGDVFSTPPDVTDDVQTTPVVVVLC
jgi:hypothetical protein